MPSEFNHIDNFFRNKNQEFSSDTSRMEADWQDMKNLLHSEAASLPQSPVLPLKWYRRFIPRVAAAILFLIATAFLVTFFAKNKKGNSLVVKTTDQPTRSLVKKTPDSVTTTIITPVVPNLAVKNSTTQKNNKQEFDNISTYSAKTKKNLIPELPAIVNNSKKDEIIPKPAKTVFEEFYTTLEKPAQDFTIDNKTDTLITCKEGTTVFIPAGSFQTLTGLAIVGLVNLKVREFYSFADIVSNKLSTSSEGKRLETGGMINIDAVSGNQPVKVKNGSFLELKMPTQSFDPTMQLFVGAKSSDNFLIASTENGKDVLRRGNKDGIDWLPAGQQQFFFTDNRREIKILNLTDNPYEIRNYKNDTKTLAKFSIPYDSPLSVDEVKTQLETKFGKYYDKIKVRREWGPMFGKKRKDTIVTTRAWYESKQVGDSITLPLDLARRLKMVSQQDSIYYETLWRKQYEDAVKQKQAWSEYVQKREAYSFRISNLGWINCDRFVEYPKGRLTDFVLNPGEGFDGGTFNAILILENERSAMQGIWSDGKIRFPSLPLGHRVNIVCAGVKNGVMVTAVQQVTISRNEVDGLEFETSSPDAFREKLLAFGDVTKPN